MQTVHRFGQQVAVRFLPHDAAHTDGRTAARAIVHHHRLTEVLFCRLAERTEDDVRRPARRERYDAYYRPANYSFGDVVESVAVASRAGVFTCLNYFVFPGVTDDPGEVDALAGLIESAGVRMIQWRNLNIDPDLYLATVPPAPEGSAFRRPWKRSAAASPRSATATSTRPYGGEGSWAPEVPSPREAWRGSW